MGLPAFTRMRGVFNDYSGTIATGGTAQWQVPKNPNRDFLFIQNHHATADLWVNFSVVAVAGQPSVRIPSGASETFEGNFSTIERVSFFGATTGQSFTVKEA